MLRNKIFFVSESQTTNNDDKKSTVMSCWCRILRGHFLLTILYNLLLSGFIFAHFIHCVHPSMVINESQILPGFCSFPIGLQITLLCRSLISSVLLSFYQLLRYTLSHRASSMMCYFLALYFSVSSLFALWFQIFIWTSELLHEYWKAPWTGSRPIPSSRTSPRRT